MNSFRASAWVILLGAMFAAGRSVSLAQNPDPTAPAKYGFSFWNFTDTEFSWDIFCHSFYGVPFDSTQTWATATFDRAFFELAFKTALPSGGGGAGSAGNCFGICLMSLMMNRFGGYYGYCAPTSAYKGDGNGPYDKALHRVINIMHGRELSVGALEAYLDQIQGGHSQHSSYGFQLAKETIGKEGPCLVCITNKWNPVDGSGGHVLIAYGVTENPTGQGHIWVVDPNRIWASNNPGNRDWYQGDSNHIDCNLGADTWKFRMADESDWPTGAGNLIIIPLSVVGPPGRVPSSIGLSLGDLLGKLLLTDTKGGGSR